MDLKVSSTIGYELRHNELFSETDEDRFVERATAKLPPQPPNFQAVVDLKPDHEAAQRAVAAIRRKLN